MHNVLGEKPQVIHERGNLRFHAGDYQHGAATCISVKRISDGHWLHPQAWWEGRITEEELAEVAQEWEAKHGGQPEPPAAHCASCQKVLDSDHDTDYQFEDALWIGFHGGYGMFVDGLEERLPTNTEDRWVVDDDGDLILDEDGHAVQDEDWEPLYPSPRILPGRPNYEAVICHDCAHALCVAVPWIDRLLQPLSSHGHTTEYWKEHPDHEGWDKPTHCCGHPFGWHYSYDKQGQGIGCAVCACTDINGS